MGSNNSNHADHFLLPDVCRNTSVLILLIAIEVAAIAVCLLFFFQDFLTSLALVSFYLIWSVVLSAFLLCKTRKRIMRLPARQGLLLAFAVCMASFLIIELSAQFLIHRFLGTGFNEVRFWRFFAAAGLIYLLVLRFFYLLGLIEWRNKTEVQARMQALQSRIRPHFLFNSLNTISELTASQPEQAEQAIASLSSLFRASLDEAKNLHTLDSEIHLCERYLELEQWRLGDKLDVVWNKAVSLPRTWLVPKLILQPLIENAVFHGQDESGRILVEIDIKETNHDLSIMVVNRKHGKKVRAKGHGIAVDNIRERLFVLYDDNQVFKIRDEQDRYQVIMRLPKQAFS